jgi:hypothetical protein
MYKLWAAYGAALALTVAAVLLGIVSLCLHGVSYSNKFSTILLAGRGAELDVHVLDADLGASDPLPAYLQKAKVQLLGSRQVELQGLNKQRSSNDGGPGY